MLSEIAHAKVNLTLRVLGRRGDGYHALESLVTFAKLGDVVSLDTGAAGGGVTVSGPFAAAIEGENLLSRLMALVAARAPDLRLGAVRLEKNLPVAAGLGGGSADAAALIRLIRHAIAGHPAVEHLDWSSIAVQLGADVPVCVLDRPALMWGIGERLLVVAQDVATRAPLPAVLVNPRLPLSTRDVFQALAAPPLPREPDPPALPHLATADDLAAYMRAIGNDLEPPARALLPAIAEVKAALTAQVGCLHAALSGSGPTCFALYASDTAAEAAARAIAIAEPGWWVAATTLAFPG